MLYNKWNIEVILKNPVYRGYVKFNDELLPGLHAPLIDEATWNRVRAIVAHHAAKHGRLSLRSQPTGGGMLTELAYCERCNSRMTYHPSTSKNGRRYGYYRCSGYERLTCEAPGVRALAVEAQMLDVMRCWHCRPSGAPRSSARPRRCCIRTGRVMIGLSWRPGRSGWRGCTRTG